jgi:hypothetical protein
MRFHPKSKIFQGNESILSRERQKDPKKDEKIGR